MICFHEFSSEGAEDANSYESSKIAHSEADLVGIPQAASALALDKVQFCSMTSVDFLNPHPTCMPAGTFLYVAFMEIIPRELGDHDQRPLKLAMLIVGFGSMSVLAIWA